MIDRLEYAKELLLERNIITPIIIIVNDKNYFTPKFMRKSELVYAEIKHLIKKDIGILGLSSTQILIFKSFVILGNRKLREFNSKDEVIKFHRFGDS
ncbi:hypothetical protein [Marivirga harenae]|uniref:hypothetical protein n=1 Tax=Marivirga harenae TaxID=2010992 RepID=UPI0026DF10CC|nr:hypothetical protein [Marivirga harenae]WKV11163.1 hypothetical protein Q3Y49_13190 [Marivirga harenae]